MMKLITFLCCILFLISEISALSASKCPQMNIEVYKMFPNLLIFYGDQKVGYNASVEMIVVDTTQHVEELDEPVISRVIVYDYFDGFTGILKKRNDTIYYYPSTNEGYLLENFTCSTFELDDDTHQEIADFWELDLSTKEYAHNFTSLMSNFTTSPGPVGLLIYLISKQYNIHLASKLSETPSRLRNTFSTGWLICLPYENAYNMQVHFNSSGQLTRIVLPFDNFKIIFNFIKLVAIERNPDDPINYPYGNGCDRKIEPVKVVPGFGESQSFMLNMRVEVSFNNHEQHPDTIKSLNIIRSNGIYSYEYSKVRIIYDPELSLYYLIKLDTGLCTIEKSYHAHTVKHEWASTAESIFKILSSLVFSLREDDLLYFGQVKLKSKLFDIYEKKANDSYSGSIRHLVTYFIRVKSQPHYPSKIEINFDPTANINRMRIEISHYLENDDLYDPIRFDVRSCESGHSSWFQIVFSDVPNRILTMKNRQVSLEHDLRKVLWFIPMLRFTDIRVGNYGPSIYITSKLLDGPSIFFAYDAQPNSTLENSDIVLKRDNDEDCGRSCSTNTDCKSFSYCSDRQCYLHTNRSLPVLTKQSDQCVVHKAKIFGFNCTYNGTIAQLEQFTSSSLILHQIKSMVKNRQLILPKFKITADYMFIVSSPFELGDYRLNKYDDSSKLRDYKVILLEHKLVPKKLAHQLTEISYLDCLYYCENDDSCLTVSYCTHMDGECTISSYSAEIVASDIDSFTNYSSKCKIMSKTYLDFFNRLPGRSLIIDLQKLPHGLRRLKDVDPEACAKACVYETSFTCEAFDYCPTELHQSFVCYLHKFHVFENSTDQFASLTWNPVNKKCDHYTRKLSMDYKQFVGMTFTDDPIITTIDDNSLENCASACNQADEGCYSFEYCESHDSIVNMSSCRLSSNKVIADISNLTESSCSVYSIKRRGPQAKVQLQPQIYHVIKKCPNVFLTIFCGLTAFVTGVVITATITNYILKKKK